MYPLVVYNPMAKQAAVNTPSPRLQSGNLNLAGSAQATGTQGLLKAGEQLTGVMAKEYASYETTRVTQSLLEYQNALSTERSSYMEQNKGENAIGAGEHFAQFARETAYPLADQFSGRFRNMFLQNAVTYGLHFREQGEAYGAQQKTAWQKSQAESLLSQTLGNIANNPGDVEYVDRQATQIKALYAEMFPGLDRRAMETELTQKMAGAAIDGFLAKGNLCHAKESFNVYKEKGYLGAAATQYEARIRAEAKRMEAEARATQDRADTVQAANLGAGLFETYGDDAIKVQSVLEGKIKDPVQRARVTQSYLSNVSLHERMKTQTEERDKAASYDNAISQTDSILAGQESEQKKAALLSGVLAGVADPATRKKLEEYLDFKINGTEAPVDKNVLAEAVTYAAQPGVRPDMVTNRYADKLPPSALGKAVKIARDEATKQSEKLMQDEITESLVDDFGYTRSQATVGYRVILSRMTGLTDPAQRLERARMLAREISVKNDAWFSSSGWGSGVKIPAYDFQQTIVEDSAFNFVEIPEKDIPQVDQWLRVRGLPLTEKNRRAAYTQFLKAKNADAQGAEN